MSCGYTNDVVESQNHFIEFNKSGTENIYCYDSIYVKLWKIEANLW